VTLARPVRSELQVLPDSRVSKGNLDPAGGLGPREALAEAAHWGNLARPAHLGTQVSILFPSA